MRMLEELADRAVRLRDHRDRHAQHADQSGHQVHRLAERRAERRAASESTSHMTCARAEVLELQREARSCAHGTTAQLGSRAARPATVQRPRAASAPAYARLSPAAAPWRSPRLARGLLDGSSVPATAAPGTRRPSPPGSVAPTAVPVSPTAVSAPGGWNGACRRAGRRATSDGAAKEGGGWDLPPPASVSPPQLPPWCGGGGSGGGGR